MLQKPIFTVSVVGSWGRLSVCKATGLVPDYFPDGGRADEYADIFRFDVPRWHALNPGLSFEDHGHDIIHVGYWDRSGAYEPAICHHCCGTGDFPPFEEEATACPHCGGDGVAIPPRAA